MPPMKFDWLPMFRNYVPKGIRPWVYVLFAFCFQMSGGVYMGRAQRDCQLSPAAARGCFDVPLLQSCGHGGLLPHIVPHEVQALEQSASFRCGFRTRFLLFSCRLRAQPAYPVDDMRH